MRHMMTVCLSVLSIFFASTVARAEIEIPPSVYELKEPLSKILFPEVNAYRQGYLQASSVHKLFYSEYGNPNGIPVVVLHGGPGAGFSPNDMRFFDPKAYRIIVFDQRGASRSKPFAELRENTTQYLIDDIEALRKYLKVGKWLVFGGSWESALGVLYGEAFPQNCLGFVLRGIFLGTPHEINHVWYGMKATYPEAWEEMVSLIPAFQSATIS